MKNKGFTLIELLVVISIISLLSSVVVSSLNSAKKKAQEAAIKTDLQSIKTQAELSYIKTGDYSAVVTEIAPILAHINSNGGTAISIFSNISPINDGYKHYAVSVKFNSDSSKKWSVYDYGNVGFWNKYNNKKDGTVGDQYANWSEASSVCKNAGGRLPTVEEFKAIHQISSQDFQPSGGYWSSTENAINSGEVWVLDIVSGQLFSVSKGTTQSFIRCVN